MHHLLVLSATTGKLGPWFPNTDAGGETLVGPLAFASGGNDLWAGGDFTAVNGVPQQGLTRFTNAPGGAPRAVPGAPKVSSSRVNKVTVSFATVVDTDNTALTYALYRGQTRVGTWSRYSYFLDEADHHHLQRHRPDQPPDPQLPRRGHRRPQPPQGNRLPSSADGRLRVDFERAIATATRVFVIATAGLFLVPTLPEPVPAGSHGRSLPR